MNDKGYISRMTNWAQHPFSTQMDLWGWVLFTVLIITIAYLWSRVLRHIAAE